LLATASPHQWLKSPVSYEAFSGQARILVEQNGMTYDPHSAKESPDIHACRWERFFGKVLPHERHVDGNSEGNHFVHPEKYWRSGLMLQGKTPDTMPQAYPYNQHELHRAYNLERALS